jgi:hypothetical protein
MQSLDDLLDEVGVYPYDSYDDVIVKSWTYDGWWTVENENGVIAIFGSETHALHFRLTLINSRLNAL